MRVLSKGGGTIDGGSSGSKDYDDLHTFLYYDDRIFSFEGIEIPVCALVASVVVKLISLYPNLNSIVKMNNTEDIFGINLGNYIPLEKLFMNGSGLDQEVLLLTKGISIPKYVLFENIVPTSGFYPTDVDKMHIFDLFGEGVESFVDILKDLPTITREEFFDLLK